MSERQSQDTNRRELIGSFNEARGDAFVALAMWLRSSECVPVIEKSFAWELDNYFIRVAVAEPLIDDRDGLSDTFAPNMIEIVVESDEENPEERDPYVELWLDRSVIDRSAIYPHDLGEALAALEQFKDYELDDYAEAGVVYLPEEVKEAKQEIATAMHRDLSAVLWNLGDPETEKPDPALLCALLNAGIACTLDDNSKTSRVTEANILAGRNRILINARLTETLGVDGTVLKSKVKYDWQGGKASEKGKIILHSDGRFEIFAILDGTIIDIEGGDNMNHIGGNEIRAAEAAVRLIPRAVIGLQRS